MKQRIPFIVALWFLVDLYFFQAVQTVTAIPALLWFYWIYDVLVGIAILYFAFSGTLMRKYPAMMSALVSMLLISFIPKFCGIPILLLEDIVRPFRGEPSRNILVSQIALGIAAIPFLGLLFGLTRGRHYYKVHRETLYFNDLPDAFDGFTITQISDVHSGSFTSAKGVQKGLDLVNQQHSDLILFTGDLVNNLASEMEPWIPAFSGLKAPFGKYSILGNHDYGDYMRWESEADQAANLNRLKQVHKEIGFRLLLNEAVSIEKDGQSIALIGVENWGKGGFHKYGDLDKATAGVSNDAFKILMSHDPSHWEAVTLGHKKHIHLTLAGHTHGMQFGIEVFGLKWSPIKYVYKQWAGLYQQGGKYLYVNRGFGFLGLKGRVGIWPEITVITLKKGKSN
jgi:predicted MPP superfamily phosphohydrolase